MRKFLIIILAVMAVNARAQSTWKVDKGHSSINFSVSHFLISDVTGNFSDFDIEAISDDKLDNPKVKVSINAASIDTNNDKRDDHLKADDFFGVEKYPNITFNSAVFENLGDGKFSITGDLSIKGITKEAVFDGKIRGIITDRNGRLKAGLKLTTVVKREEFNVGNGMASIGDDVTVEINLEMSQQ
ncbi:YceI family protein [Fulvivirgaceae bacterium BMA10]|uniref:YceI family protein n=1 Tax=Splendidivirga corallicola TaxID=3051826 RepID=A0ABT8KYA2_9BACT|nr:YceI family protein [Fulvivirgaceae bacterium BMA10]